MPFGVPQSKLADDTSVYGDVSWLTEKARDIAREIDARKPVGKWGGCYDPKDTALLIELADAMVEGGFTDHVFLDCFYKPGDSPFSIPLCHILVFSNMIEGK